MLIRRRRQRRSRFSWRQLAFEAFVVVLGVTLALGANELRQHFLDQRRVRVATESIAAEMQQNCDRLTTAQDYHERVIAELDSVRVADPAALKEGYDVRTLPSWQGYGPAFATTAAYETAQATGALGLMPYGRALGLGSYYTFVGLYQETVQQVIGTTIQGGGLVIAQAEVALYTTTGLQRGLASQSCDGARRLHGETDGAAPPS